MDFQNRVGSKTGGGGQASYSESNRDRRERLAALAAETIALCNALDAALWIKVAIHELLIEVLKNDLK